MDSTQSSCKTKKMSPNDEQVNRALLGKTLHTWDIEETVDGQIHVLTLRIQGSIYRQTRASSILEAYQKLLLYVAEPLSRSVTIARLMGGSL